jgi:hypothetical protein
VTETIRNHLGKLKKGALAEVSKAKLLKVLEDKT